MVWPETRRAIALARSRFPRATITLQTNAVLMDRAKARALRSLGVVVQPGIDGGQLSSARHRRGTTPVRFRAMVRGIKALIREGVPLCLSMTVHPSEVDAMEENYSWLRNLGDVSLEVHPAFLSPWTNKAGECFVRAYRDISVKDLEAGRPWLRRDYSVPGPLAVDLVVRPDGRVLPNWTCLMFPRRVSEPFCLLEIAPKGIVVKHEAMGRYLDSLNRFFGKLRTYREFSNFHAEKALAACPGSRLRLRYNVYQRICEQVQKIDQRCLAARGRGEREFISRR
jgi:MoaA/NifB/PqqE/SkfB family radical SAM enzyme